MSVSRGAMKSSRRCGSARFSLTGWRRLGKKLKAPCQRGRACFRTLFNGTLKRGSARAQRVDGLGSRSAKRWSRRWTLTATRTAGYVAIFGRKSETYGSAMAPLPSQAMAHLQRLARQAGMDR